MSAEKDYARTVDKMLETLLIRKGLMADIEYVLMAAPEAPKAWRSFIAEVLESEELTAALDAVSNAEHALEMKEDEAHRTLESILSRRNLPLLECRRELNP